MTRMSRIQRRAMQFGHVLTWCTDWHTNPKILVELLTDALHWCDANREDFLAAFAQAYQHYLNDLNNAQTDERKIQ